MNIPSRSEKKQSGLSLIELMIAMTLGLVLVAGISQLFIGNKQATELTQNLGYMQENIRMTNHFLGDAIRMSGQLGGIDDPSKITGNVTIQALGDCDGAWALNLEESILGYNGASSVTGITGFPSGCITNYQPNTDILLVRYADSSAMVTDANIVAQGDKAFLRTSIVPDDDYVSQIFKAADGFPSSMTKQLSTYNMPLRADMYYLKTCSQQGSDGTCQNNIPSLARISLNGLTVIDQVLVEGVEQMQFEYGVDANRDGTVTTYVNAASVSDWNQIASIRYSVLVRASKEDAQHSDTKNYALSSDTASYQAATADQKLYRKLITQTVQQKNKI